MYLTRISADKCLLSRQEHQTGDAALVIQKNERVYNIYFYCGRKCRDHKQLIGSLMMNSLIPSIHPDFIFKKKKKNKKK